MVIILGIAFIVIAIAGSLIKRHYHRKQDKINAGFNAGITERAVPVMASVPPMNYNGVGGTPYRPDSPRGRAMYLPNVREKDRVMVQQGPDLSEITESSSNFRSGTPVSAVESGQFRSKKGKNRMEI